jgi:excisionase family DNA binding protein
MADSSFPAQPATTHRSSCVLLASATRSPEYRRVGGDRVRALGASGGGGSHTPTSLGVIVVNAMQRIGPPASPRPGAALLTVRAVAAHLAVSEKTVRRLIQRGQLTVLRVGRSLRIAEADLRAYLNCCRQ